MRNYLFLDNWVLSTYTSADRVIRLSDFIRRNQFTICISTLSLVELYNPGWEHAPEKDRMPHVVHFLGQHPCVIVDPQHLFRREIEVFPDTLEQLPLELDLEELPQQARIADLLGFLRRDQVFLAQGKDIANMAKNYQELKTNWLRQAEHIIEDGIARSLLVRDARDTQGEQFLLEQCDKEAFLQSLDRRHFGHFSAKDTEDLGPKIVELMLGATAMLPAIRLSSLCFWYSYIAQDKANRTKKQASDIGDFYQLSILPYCTAFTVDTAMYRLMQRIRAEVPYRCEMLDQERLNTLLNQESI